MKKILLAGLAVLLIGCKHKPVSGVIVKKRLKPPQTIVTVVNTGKACVPITTVIPASWLIVIEDSAGKRHRLEISRREYDNVKTGQRIINDSIVWQ